ncbi:MAG: cytochrome c3 family protein [Thermoanaerobaculia bacterium]
MKAINKKDCKGEEMKKITLIVLVVAFVATSASAQTVVGTAHDLSTTLTTGSQVCAFCHTPHGSNVDAVLQTHAPLWNQDLSATSNFGTYASDTFDATDLVAITDASYSDSLLCMSCHDGTVAPGSFYNEPNPTGNSSSAVAISSGANMGTDLSNDHPVNFTYASSVTGGDGGLVAEAGIVAYLDTGAVGGKVQCSSCHDPHNAAGDADVDFMRVSLAKSLLCTTCHMK